MTKDYPLHYYDRMPAAQRVYESSDKSFYVYHVHEQYEFPYTVEIKYESIDRWETIGSGFFDRYGQEIKVNRLIKYPDNKCTKCTKDYEEYENCYVSKSVHRDSLKTVLRVYGAHSHICEECASSYQRKKVFEDDSYVENVNHSGSTWTSYGESKTGVNPIYDEDAPKTFDYEVIGQRRPSND